MSTDKQIDAYDTARKQQEEARRLRNSGLPSKVAAPSEKLPFAPPADLATSIDLPSNMDLTLETEIRNGEETTSPNSEVEILKSTRKSYEIFPYPLANRKIGVWQQKVPYSLFFYAVSRETVEDNYSLERAVELYNEATGRNNTSSIDVNKQPKTAKQLDIEINMIFSSNIEEEMEILDVEEHTYYIENEDEKNKRISEIEIQNRISTRKNEKTVAEDMVSCIANLMHASMNQHGQLVKIEEIVSIMDLPVVIEWLWRTFQVNKRSKIRF